MNGAHSVVDQSASRSDAVAADRRAAGTSCPGVEIDRHLLGPHVIEPAGQRQVDVLRAACAEDDAARSGPPLDHGVGIGEYRVLSAARNDHPLCAVRQQRLRADEAERVANGRVDAVGGNDEVGRAAIFRWRSVRAPSGMRGDCRRSEADVDTGSPRLFGQRRDESEARHAAGPRVEPGARDDGIARVAQLRKAELDAIPGRIIAGTERAQHAQAVGMDRYAETLPAQRSNGARAASPTSRARASAIAAVSPASPAPTISAWRRFTCSASPVQRPTWSASIDPFVYP